MAGKGSRRFRRELEKLQRRLAREEAEPKTIEVILQKAAGPRARLMKALKMSPLLCLKNADEEELARLSRIPYHKLSLVLGEAEEKPPLATQVRKEAKLVEISNLSPALEAKRVHYRLFWFLLYLLKFRRLHLLEVGLEPMETTDHNIGLLRGYVEDCFENCSKVNSKSGLVRPAPSDRAWTSSRPSPRSAGLVRPAPSDGAWFCLSYGVVSVSIPVRCLPNIVELLTFHSPAFRRTSTP